MPSRRLSPSPLFVIVAALWYPSYGDKVNADCGDGLLKVMTEGSAYTNGNAIGSAVAATGGVCLVIFFVFCPTMHVARQPVYLNGCLCH